LLTAAVGIERLNGNFGKLTTTLRRGTLQKSEDLIYIEAEA
jgi:hypothetical protein